MFQFEFLCTRENDQFFRPIFKQVESSLAEGGERVAKKKQDGAR